MLLVTLVILIVIMSMGFSTQAVTVTKILGFDTNDYSNGVLPDNTGYGIKLKKVGDGKINVVSGKNGNALYFDNAGLGIDELGLNLGRQYTICTTVRFTESIGKNQRIFGTGIHSMGAGFTMIITPDGKYLFAGAANNKEQFIGFSDTSYSPNADNLYDGVWHSIALVVDLDKGYQRLYVDGGIEYVTLWNNEKVLPTEDGTYIMCDSKYNSVSELAFAIGCGGISKTDYADFGKMYIQDFAIYNKAFTINDFRNLLGLKGIENGDINDPSAPVATIIDTSKLPKTIPNNFNKNSIIDAKYGVLIPAEEKNGLITYMSIASIFVCSIVFIISLIFFARRRENVSKNL